LAGIKNEIAALDFDLACTLRLQIYDNQAEKARVDYLANEILGGLLGKNESQSNDEKTLSDAEYTVW
jgi:hypothetical protein